MLHRTFRSWIYFLLPVAAFPVVCGCSHFKDESGGDLSFTLEPAARPSVNPLIGFMPYAGEYPDFPHSMEFFYLAMRDLQTGPATFDWTRLERQLNQIAARGHQAVFRVYLDYPKKSYGVPDFLQHVPKRRYTDFGNGRPNQSYSPDYEHPDLVAALKNLIAALGARYDGDPRVGFIQAGLLGFWGEWHTYPHNDWMASPRVMNMVLDAYEQAFRETLILMREPKEGVHNDRPRVGFHDDSFAWYTVGPTDWHFASKLQAFGLGEVWKSRPIGGEVRPEIQAGMWQLPPKVPPEYQDFDTCVRATHASWLLNEEAFYLRGEDKERAIRGAQLLGYEFVVTSCSVRPYPLPAQKTFEITLRISNRGVAPFYYPWPIEIGLASPQGLQQKWATPWDLRTLLPGDGGVKWSHLVPITDLGRGTYLLLLRVVNPLENGFPLRFANTAQDKDITGWLTLGEVVIR